MDENNHIPQEHIYYCSVCEMSTTHSAPMGSDGAACLAPNHVHKAEQLVRKWAVGTVECVACQERVDSGLFSMEGNSVKHFCISCGADALNAAVAAVEAEG